MSTRLTEGYVPRIVLTIIGMSFRNPDAATICGMTISWVSTQSMRCSMMSWMLMGSFSRNFSLEEGVRKWCLTDYSLTLYLWYFSQIECRYSSLFPWEMMQIRCMVFGFNVHNTDSIANIVSPWIITVACVSLSP